MDAITTKLLDKTIEIKEKTNWIIMIKEKYCVRESNNYNSNKSISGNAHAINVYTLTWQKSIFMWKNNIGCLDFNSQILKKTGRTVQTTNCFVIIIFFIFQFRESSKNALFVINFRHNVGILSDLESNI